MKKQFTESDGKLVLILHPAEEGGYTVTCPFDPAMITQAETIEEAFEMARDASKAARAKLFNSRRKSPHKKSRLSKY